jgi:5-bromo-4-chloroindolyl phosphate hydrolysis protein
VSEIAKNQRRAEAQLPASERRASVREQWWSWVSLARVFALFALPFPLLLAIVAAVIAADGSRLALTVAALACFWTAGVMTWRGLAAEAQYLRGLRTDLPRLPAKLVGAFLTAAGSAAAATAGGEPALAAAVFGAIGAGGHVCFYGGSLRPRRFAIAAVDGVDATAVTRQLQEAYQRLRRIQSAARLITVQEFCDRLDRITSIGQSIIAQIERDPRDASRARRFLNLYLDSAERITSEFAVTHRQVRDAALEQNFRQLLIEMESTFSDQRRKLLEHDVLSLDVDIEVLNARLKRDVAAELQETPR